ncbi:McrB family protein [Rothia nasimurium]|uniref:McrB family protein n=1 Tax=Rothia nasimurium TaxID=85336 RepID=UPI001F02C604|nr:AAA family ATPase [Rothia nasimurium]
MSLFDVNEVNFVSWMSFKDYRNKAEELGKENITDRSLRYRILKKDGSLVADNAKIKELIVSFCKHLENEDLNNEFRLYFEDNYFQEGLLNKDGIPENLNNQMFTGIDQSKPLFTFSKFIEFLESKDSKDISVDNYWIEARLNPQNRNGIEKSRPVLCTMNNGEHGKSGWDYYCFMGPEETISYPNFAERLDKDRENPSSFGNKLCVPNFSEISLSGLPEGRAVSGKNIKSLIKGLNQLGYGSPVNNNGSNLQQMKKFREIVEENFADYELKSMEIKAVLKGSSSDLVENSNNETNEGEVMEFSERVVRELESNTNVIVEGVAGAGKSHLLQELRKNGVYGEDGSQLEVVVFHPSTSYEEFVSGIRPNFMKEEGEGEFVSQEGVFVEMCNRAADTPDKKYLLFIDEINRANTSRVFGDLMLVLEESKRQDFKDLPEAGRSGALLEASVQDIPGEYVRLQTPIYKNGKEYNKLVVPSNLHVLGTMNTTDRSVGTIDLALRRRFHWITQEPMSDRDELLTALELSEGKEESVGLVVDWFMHANTVLKTEVGPDARLGHAYFFGKDGDTEAIAEALLNQLKEIAFTFNIDEKVLWGHKGQETDADFWQNNEDKKSIGAIKVNDVYWAIRYEGKGLGRRPETVKNVSIAKAEG